MDDLERFMASMVTQGPCVDLEAVEWLLHNHYGIAARAERLTGERDQNFRIHVPNGAGYIFKIVNPAEPAATVGLSLNAMIHLEKTDPSLPCPRVIRNNRQDNQIEFIDASGSTRTAMLFTYLPGNPLLSTVRSSEQRSNCGRLLARVAHALRSFEHPAIHRTIVWDLKQLPRLESLLPTADGLPDAAFIIDFLTRFSSEISPRLAAVRQQFVHNDFNARNIIVDPSDASLITGIIDFGDSVHTALVADVAVGIVGQLASPETAEKTIRDFVRAYCDVESLLPEELALLPFLIAGRIVQSVVIMSWHRAHNRAATHFDGFDTRFFKWRLALAKRLVSRRHVISYA